MFYFSFISILCIWVLYPLLIVLLSRLVGKKYFTVDRQPDITVIIAAHNEESDIIQRCENIFSQCYDANIEIIVASDGSNDNTISLISDMEGVVSIDIQPQSGRSNAHNLSVEKASFDILVFTDAGTKFENNFLKNLVMPFSDSGVGFATGTLCYKNIGENDISQSVGIYWRFEMLLRKAESVLGLYSTGTGACCAVRKELYKTIPSTGDVDFITPLDVILAGKKCIHVDNAIAIDELPDTPVKELKARIRMTSKNFSGTFKRWGIRNMFKKPVYSLSIFLHKIGRWLTPFLLIALLFSNMFKLDDGVFYVFIFLGQIVFYFLALLGYFDIGLAYSKQIYSFCLANVGFFIGVIKALLGYAPSAYKPVGHQEK